MKPRDPQQTEKTSLIDKMSHEGPVTLSKSEKRQLQKAFSDLTQANLELRRLNSAMGLAIYRKRLQVTHEEHSDGSVSFDLVPDTEPDTKPITVN